MYTYDPEPHPVFQLPPPETTLWRYQSLPKLLSLLDNRRLFFCRASNFKDRFEGAWPKRLVERMLEYHARGSPADRTDDFSKERRRIREIMSISCWHASPYESDAMWNVYGLNQEGAALKSSVARLTGALPQKQTPAGKQDIHSVFVGKVHYVDYRIADFPPHNVYYPYVHKRLGFDYEKEVRAVAIISKAAIDAFEAGDADFELSEGGLALPVNVETLIEAVHISPLGSPSFERVVRATLERFGFGSIPVIKSELAEDPAY